MSLPLKSVEFILYFWVFTFGIENEVPLLREYGIFFSLYIFHMKLGLSLLLDLYISMARTCKCLWWVFSLLSKAKSSSYVAMQLFIKFYIYKLFRIFAYIFLSRTSKLTGNRQTDFLLLNNLRFAFSCVRNFLSLLRAYSLRILLICSLKFNLESIVIPSSLTDETDFVNKLPICNVSESVFPRTIN